MPWIARVHRWLGISIGAMLAIWFATGTVLSFVPFPELNVQERLAMRESLDPGAVRVLPGAALASLGDIAIERVRLISVDGRPRYVVSIPGRGSVAIDATSGVQQTWLDAGDAARVAARHSGLDILRVEGPLEYDQWTVHDPYDEWRPFHKVTLDDAAGTVLYVSASTGEVVQQTRRFERAWNRVGAVVHWLNFAPLRWRDGLWHATVWSLALLGITLTILGLTLGIIRTLQLRRLRRRGVSPFRGLLRWHHLAGLCAALLIANWIVSGWLSLDHGIFFSTGKPSPEQQARLRGVSLRSAAEQVQGLALSETDGVKEIELAALGGRALLIVRGTLPELPRVIRIEGEGTAQTPGVLPDALLVGAVEAAWSPARVVRLERIEPGDRYARRGQPYPANARRLVLDDPKQTWVHLVAASGEVLSVMDPGRRTYRWLVDGLHNLDFAPLNRAGVWHVLLVTATTAGFSFVMTGIVLAVRRVRRNFAARLG
ncbi:MAG: PepSY domain-containing protein [Gammaproteobacteria bacterium]